MNDGGNLKSVLPRLQVHLIAQDSFHATVVWWKILPDMQDPICVLFVLSRFHLVSVERIAALSSNVNLSSGLTDR